jgi:hypothetical protein
MSIILFPKILRRSVSMGFHGRISSHLIVVHISNCWFGMIFNDETEKLSVVTTTPHGRDYLAPWNGMKWEAQVFHRWIHSSSARVRPASHPPVLPPAKSPTRQRAAALAARQTTSPVARQQPICRLRRICCIPRSSPFFHQPPLLARAYMPNPLCCRLHRPQLRSRAKSLALPFESSSPPLQIYRPFILLPKIPLRRSLSSMGIL